MAKDDMEVIIYKILSYLYRCLREDIKPHLEDICYASDLLDINENYWNAVMHEIISNGFVHDIVEVPTSKGAKVEFTINPRISMQGVEFLHENSGMKNAQEVVGKAFEIVLSAVLSR